MVQPEQPTNQRFLTNSSKVVLERQLQAPGEVWHGDSLLLMEEIRLTTWYWEYPTHTIHVWYIYPHLVDSYGKCW